VDAWIASSSPGRFRVSGLAIFFAVAMFADAVTAIVRAQTLTNPTPAKTAPTASSQHNKPPKSCPMYGPGFVQVPGSDLCVKVGGSVQGDVTIGR
jgi:Porin subfamily